MTTEVQQQGDPPEEENAAPRTEQERAQLLEEASKAYKQGLDQLLEDPTDAANLLAKVSCPSWMSACMKHTLADPVLPLLSYPAVTGFAQPRLWNRGRRVRGHLFPIRTSAPGVCAHLDRRARQCQSPV